VTDDNGCDITDEVIITEPDAMDINITIDQVILCNGDLSGILTANASGGTGTKSYVWNDPGNQTVKTATNLGAGYYTVTATDVNECEVEEAIQLSQPAVLILSPIPQNVSCNGAGDGLINLNVSGGTPAFNYDWSNGAITQDISNLSPGMYSVTVTDANLCEAYIETEIVEPDVLKIDTIISTDANCYTNPDGEIVIGGIGGVPNYEYSIDNGDSFLADSTFSDIGAATYTVIIRDANSCLSASTDATIAGPEELVVVNQSVDGSTITVEAGGGVPPYTYTLDGSEENSTGVFTNVDPGTHSVSVTDANDCGTIIIDDLEVITAIEDLSINNLSIYPNPSNGIFYFEFNTLTENEYRIQVYSMTGSLVSDELLHIDADSQHKFSIDLTDAKSGAYIVKLNGEALNRKLIIE
jgi:hypothetical protein